MGSNTSYFDILYVWRPNTWSAVRSSSNGIIGYRNFLFYGKRYTEKDTRNF